MDTITPESDHFTEFEPKLNEKTPLLSVITSLENNGDSAYCSVQAEADEKIDFVVVEKRDRKRKGDGEQCRPRAVSGAGEIMVYVQELEWQYKMPMYLSLIIFVVLYDVLVITVKYVRLDIFTKEKLAFAPTTIIFLAEIAKLWLSLIITYFREHKSLDSLWKELKIRIFMDYQDMFWMLFPAGFWVIQNNFLHFAAHELNVATFQVTHQLKIIFAALFRIALLRKRLIPTQWLGLVALVIGVAMVQVAQTDPFISDIDLLDEKDDDEHHFSHSGNKSDGFIFVFVACILSGFCGAFLEFVLKKRPEISIWMRNVQLALWSIPFALSTCFYFDFDMISENGFFHGYGILMWILVFLYAVFGLSVGVMIRHAGIILKGFATCLAIIIACLASLLFFDFHFTELFIAGAALVAFSIFLYSYHPPIKTLDDDTPVSPVVSNNPNRSER